MSAAQENYFGKKYSWTAISKVLIFFFFLNKTINKLGVWIQRMDL
jgi:hypothetical protein